MTPNLRADKVDVAIFAFLLLTVGLVGHLTVTELPTDIEEGELQPAADAECYGMGCTLQRVVEKPLQYLTPPAILLAFTLSISAYQRWQS